MALTTNVIGAINFISILLSVPVIGAGIWLATQSDNSCVKTLQWPVIVIGILILAVATAGFVGGFWKIPTLVVCYFIGMLVLIVLLAALVVFVYMVTMRGSGRVEPSRLYLEYRLDDYSGWLRRRVMAPYKWDGIKMCLGSAGFCGELNQSFSMAQDFFNAHLTPLQSGCCKPPTQCGYTFVTPTYWISPINIAADMDCLQWNNEESKLCFECDSCKAGLLQSLEKEWRRVDIVLVITLVALICVYLMGCCVFRNGKTEELFRKYKQGYT